MAALMFARPASRTKADVTTGRPTSMGNATTRSLLVLSAALLGVGVWWRTGLYAPVAVALVGGALLVALAVLAFQRLAPRAALPELVPRLLYSAAVVALAFMRFGDPPLNDIGAPSAVWVYHLAWATAAGLALALAWLPSRWLRPAALLLLTSVAAGGIWAIRQNAAPHVDVYVFQRDGCAALLEGQNPYAITYPNIYSDAESWVYGPGMLKNGRLQFGYPYMPLTLLASLPGHLLAGDYRYSLVAWLVLPLGLAVWRQPSRATALGVGLAAMFPKLPMVFEWGWSEPVVAGLLVLAVALPGEGGAFWFVMGKQYVLPFLPAVVLRRVTPRQWIAGAVAGCLTLGLVLWNLPAFWHSAIALQFHQPFRNDSLSFAAWLFWMTGGKQLPNIASLGILAAGVAWLSWHAWTARDHSPERSNEGPPFALAIAVVLGLFFFFSKQAFANYYFLVYVALCAALMRTREEDPFHPQR